MFWAHVLKAWYTEWYPREAGPTGRCLDTGFQGGLDDWPFLNPASPLGSRRMQLCFLHVPAMMMACCPSMSPKQTEPPNPWAQINLLSWSSTSTILSQCWKVTNSNHSSPHAGAIIGDDRNLATCQGVICYQDIILFSVPQWCLPSQQLVLCFHSRVFHLLSVHH